jgi:hypothetical protein
MLGKCKDMLRGWIVRIGGFPPRVAGYMGRVIAGGGIRNLAGFMLEALPGKTGVPRLVGGGA